MLNKYYVYALLDPSKEDQIFYIGKGCGKRVKRHYMPHSLKLEPFSHKNLTILSYRNFGLKDKYRFEAENLSKDEALSLEKYLINKYGRRINNTGILTNVSEGGEDPPVKYGKDSNGYKISKDGRNPITLLSKQGKHPSTLAKINGTYWMNGKNNHFYKIKPWLHPSTNEHSLSMWLIADDVYKIWQNNLNLGRIKFQVKCETILNKQLHNGALRNMLKYFRNGWIPREDIEWLKYKGK